MSHPTVCPECSAPMRKEWQGSLYTGWHCSTPWVHELQADRDTLFTRVAELETELANADQALIQRFKNGEITSGAEDLRVAIVREEARKKVTSHV